MGSGDVYKRQRRGGVGHEKNRKTRRVCVVDEELSSSSRSFFYRTLPRASLRAGSAAGEVSHDRGRSRSRRTRRGVRSGERKSFRVLQKKQKPRHLSGACVLVRHGWTIISRISPRVSPPVTKNVVTETASRNARAETKKFWRRKKKRKRTEDAALRVTSPRARFPGPRASPCSDSSPGRPTTCPGTSRR